MNFNLQEYIVSTRIRRVSNSLQPNVSSLVNHSASQSSSGQSNAVSGSAPLCSPLQGFLLYDVNASARSKAARSNASPGTAMQFTANQGFLLLASPLCSLWHGKPTLCGAMHRIAGLG